MEVYLSKLLDLTIEYAPKLALAIITLIFGLWIIAIIINLFEKTLIASKVDKTLIPFLKSLTSWGLKILLFISVASMIGIATTSFVAVLGAAGLAIGLALQGSLSNFAGGVLLLVFKPYKVGDVIESQGFRGKVEEIQIFNTILVTFQNRTIIIPNSVVSSNSIVNISGRGTIRADIEIGISYSSNIDKAKEVILSTVAKNEKVLKNPACEVGVKALADSSVNLLVMPWCKPEDYWEVFFGLTEDIKKALDANEITIPFPQRDVHIINS